MKKLLSRLFARPQPSPDGFSDYLLAHCHEIKWDEFWQSILPWDKVAAWKLVDKIEGRYISRVNEAPAKFPNWHNPTHVDRAGYMAYRSKSFASRNLSYAKSFREIINATKL